MAEEQSEETKTEAREFMRGLVGSAPEESAEFTGGDGMDMAALRTTYAAASPSSSSNNDTSSSTRQLLEKLWSMYDPSQTSIWTMTYDEADSNEDLDETIDITTQFMKQTQSIKGHCFGIMHTTLLGDNNLEIEGLWFFNDPDPERLFGVNEDSSWFSWSQFGPEANEYVKKSVAELLVPVDGKLKSKTIKHTEILE